MLYVHKESGANFHAACAHTSDKMQTDTAARMQSYYDTMQKQG